MYRPHHNDDTIQLHNNCYAILTAAMKYSNTHLSFCIFESCVLDMNLADFTSVLIHQAFRETTDWNHSYLLACWDPPVTASWINFIHHDWLIQTPFLQTCLPNWYGNSPVEVSWSIMCEINHVLITTTIRIKITCHVQISLSSRLSVGTKC